MKQQLLPKDLLREARKVEDVETAVVNVLKKKEESPQSRPNPFFSFDNQFRFPSNMGETQRHLEREQRNLEEIRRQAIAAQQATIDPAYISSLYQSGTDLW